jgi:hypothetical protein
MTSGKLVTLNEYPNLEDARLVQKKLRDAGIPAHIQGEALALIGTRPEFAPITIEIAEGDLEYAHRVLGGEDAAWGDEANAEEFPLDSDGLAAIAVFHDTLDAEHAAKLLRDRGIVCQLRGTSTGYVPALGPGIANLRLVIPPDDIDRACEILRFSEEPHEADQDGTPECRCENLCSDITEAL